MKRQNAYKIIYSRYDGISRRAVDFLNKELSKLLIREEGVYVLYVLPTECEADSPKIPDNAFVVGLYNESELIRGFISEDEMGDNSYFYKVVRNPENEEGAIALITAREEKHIYNAVSAFLDDFPYATTPMTGGVPLYNELYDRKLKEYSGKGKELFATRSIFTWGHVLGNYRKYLDEMARMKLNEIILWNDFVPVNAREVVEYAHSLGIKVLFGYAWGWRAGRYDDIVTLDDEFLNKLSDECVAEYKRDYASLGADGIYFQSFTEKRVDTLHGRLIADVVTDFVNKTAGRLLDEFPTLRIQFGLHATSVKDHLDSIARVDKRIEIVWEDCGEFPYGYVPRVEDEAAYEKTLEFTKKIINLRGKDAPTGLVIKGFMILYWEKFEKQRGKFILGENSTEAFEHDKRLRRDMWRGITADWLQYGEYVQRFLKLVSEVGGEKTNICLAGSFDGGIYYPEALCTEMMWDVETDFRALASKVYKRSYLE